MITFRQFSHHHLPRKEFQKQCDDETAAKLPFYQIRYFWKKFIKPSKILTNPFALQINQKCFKHQANTTEKLLGLGSKKEEADK